LSYTDLMQLLENEARKLNIPFVGNFELTNKCNLKCQFCYIQDRNHNSSELDTSEWIRIVSEMSSIGLTRATFTGGEIFTRNDLEEIYCSSYDTGVRITLLTNGLLIDEADCKYLQKRLPEGISITLYGVSDYDYARVTGDNEGFQKIQKTISLLKQYHIPFSLKTLALPVLEKQLIKIKQFAYEQGVKITLTKYISPTSMSILPVERLPASIIKEYASMFDNANDIMGGVRNSDSCSIASCNAGKARFSISADGSMFGCICYPEVQIPINKRPCLEVLSELRANLKKVQTTCEDCISCPYKTQCGKCGGLNYMETGSVSKCSDYRKELAKYNLA